jgi:molecular chaperone GrpE (heat shock protein)
VKKTPESAQIGEMMLAKTVLEEKNEQLEAKDLELRELTSRQRLLLEEVEELKGELERSMRENAEVRREGRLEGAREVVEEVVGVLADWGQEEAKLAAHLLAVLGKKHGLEVIDEVPHRLDPRLHRVLEVSQEAESGIQLLARGFRLGGRVLRPALVKVNRAAQTAPPV